MSGINRVTTAAQNTQNLLNLLRNEQSLNQVLLQQSSGLKAQTYAGVATQAGQLLNVTSLSSQAQSFLNNISTAQTKLSLTDTALQSIGSIASNFQQELQQLQSSPTPPNISDLARTSLQQLMSLLDTNDGTSYLFSGSEQNSAPVKAPNITRIPTTTIGLSGNLDTSGTAPVNGNVAPPAAGSYLDTSLTGANAVFDSNGVQYDTTVRYVHQSANQWQAYVVGFVRSDDNSKSATYNGQPISASNPVPVGAPFDPSASPPFDQIGNAVGNTLNFDNLGTSGVPQIALPAGGGQIQVDINANNITNTNGALASSEMDNATPTSQVILNQLNLNPDTPVGDSTTITLSGPNALFATGAQAGGDKLTAQLQLTKVQAADPTTGRPEMWQASIVSLKDANGNDVAQAIGGTNSGLPISPSNPYVVGSFTPGQIQLGEINIGAPGSSTTDSTGQVFEMDTTNNGALDPSNGGISLRAGTVTTSNTSGTAVTQFSVNPLPPPGSPQTIEVSANLSSATPVNISVAQPTPGSFADISFNNGQALVDSSGAAHNMTMRLVKVSTGPDMYQAYATSLTDVESGKDSTNPPISTTNPVAIGVPFDPTAIPSTGLNFSFAPTLTNGATMAVSLPIGPNTFDLKGGNVTLSGATNTSSAASRTPNGALNIVGNLSSAATAVNATGLGLITVSGGGTGYAAGDTITFDTPPGGVAATATVTKVDSTGAITGIQVTSPGSGYTTAPVVVGTSGSGSGETLNTSFGPGLDVIDAPIGGLDTLTVNNGGSGYNVGDIVTFAAPPGGVAATAVVTSVGGANDITGLTLVDPGSGYTSTTPLTVAGTNGTGTGASVNPTLSTVNTSNTFDLTFAGNEALRDSSGHAYTTTVRMQYGSINGGAPGWRAYVTGLTDPATGLSVLPSGSLPQAIGTPPFDAFHPQDAKNGAITIPSNGPQTITLPGGASLSLSIPFNSENFTSTPGANNLEVGGSVPDSLSSDIADTTYFQPGGQVFDTAQNTVQFRTAADQTVNFGVRADDPAFEKLYRVLNFFMDQSVPADPDEVNQANQLLDSSIQGINALRANVANTQTVLKSEQTYHQTTINLATDTASGIITADSATTAMNLNAISNQLQESFATLGIVKGLSLVNYLK